MIVSVQDSEGVKRRDNTTEHRTDACQLRYKIISLKLLSHRAPVIVDMMTRLITYYPPLLQPFTASKHPRSVKRHRASS